MESIKNIVVFDFCETLVDFQTADAFVEYVCEHSNKRMVKNRKAIYRFLNQFRIIDVLEFFTGWKKSYHKKICLWQIKGICRETLEQLSIDYYNSRIKPHLIDKTVLLLQKYVRDKNIVVLVSGGYDIYLKHFAVEYGVNQVISSKLKFRNNRFTGYMDGLDCLNENKVILYKERFKCFKKTSIKASYSDSITDIPILKIAENAFVVSRKHQSWVDDYGFKEIIW